MSKIQVRRAEVSDLEQLTDLFEGYRKFYKKEPDRQSALEFLGERLTLNDSVIFICLQEDKLCAFTQLYPLFSSTKMKRLWLLNDLYVSEDFRGLGMSKLLIERCKKYNRETNGCGLILETGKSNDIGNSLYPSIGFKLDTEYNHYSWERDLD